MAWIPCHACPLRQPGMFAPSSSAEITFIQSFKRREVQFETGMQVMQEGSPAGDLYTLLEGWAFRLRMLSDGRRQILNFLLPGDFIGLQENLTAHSQHGV